MAFSNGPNIAANGLFLVLDAADKNSYPGSGTAWIDVSSTGGLQSGSLINGPTFNSDNGGSIVFDGVDDFVRSSDLNAGFPTVSTWVYKTSSTTNQGICSRSISAYTLAQINGTLQVRVHTVGSFIDTGYTIPLNEWTNITYVYNGTGLSGSQIVYINGTNIFSTTAGSGSLPGGRVRDGFFSIGYYNANNIYWGGRIAQIQVYGRALSIPEVLQNYNVQKPRFGL